MGLIDIAKELSKNAHQNQFDKAGQPYYLHPEKVASFVETDMEKAVAYLHDVLEDTETTVEDFRKAGISEEVVEAVVLLTHKKDEPYFDYLKKVKQNDLAREVKLADLKHNSDISRLENPSEKDFERLEKYKRARKFLME
ncbi:GTP pyrophosphokinase [Enterococcus sp. MJM16]|uniref:GTP pyrophosphokinase n=1 Tax=Enterococcus TaxID=1350 RepID=UPI001F5C66A1|nr:GTP pyrophosphokinase [Enterococcus sp. MJM16]